MEFSFLLTVGWCPTRFCGQWVVEWILSTAISPAVFRDVDDGLLIFTYSWLVSHTDLRSMSFRADILNCDSSRGFQKRFSLTSHFHLQLDSEVNRS